MTFTCPNCKKGKMISRRRYRKCSKCGFIKYKSPHGSQQGTILFPPEEKKEKIPKIVTKEGRREEKKYKDHAIPKGEGYHTSGYKDQKFIHDEQKKMSRRRAGILEILKKLRKNKYNPVKTIEIEGEIWDVEKGKTLAEIAEEERKGKEPEEELASDRAIEDLVKTDTG